MKMQILKGNILKSVTVENILKSTNSYCYVYYDVQLPFPNYYVNSKVGYTRANARIFARIYIL